MLFLLCKTICFTSEEIEDLNNLVDANQDSRFSPENAALIKSIFQNSYFNSRVEQPETFLSGNNWRASFSMYFNLLPNETQNLFPVAVNIFFGDVAHVQGTIKAYQSLMMQEDEIEKFSYDGNDLFDMKKHFEKMLEEDAEVVLGVPYAGVLYEWAVLTVEDPNTKKPRKVLVCLTQLQLTDISSPFMIAEDDQQKQQNSLTFVNSLIKIAFHVSQINKHGLFYRKIQMENILISGNFYEWDVFVTNFSNLVSFDLLKKKGYQISSETFKEPQKYSQFVSGEQCILSISGEEEFLEDWLKIPVSELSDSTKTLIKKAPFVTPISSAFSENTIQLVNIFLKFFQINSQKDSKMNLSDGTLMKVMKYLADLKAGFGPGFTKTPTQLYEELQGLSGGEVELANAPWDPYLETRIEMIKEDNMEGLDKKIQEIKKIMMAAYEKKEKSKSPDQMSETGSESQHNSDLTSNSSDLSEHHSSGNTNNMTSNHKDVDRDERLLSI
jgi:hypothetical protein